jgi:hypothetical protein
MPEHPGTATPSHLRALRDAAVRDARGALDAGDWRLALACLFRAQRYDNQADLAERTDASPQPP